ncbi:MAG: hypothetical protein AAF460_09420 [Pseudomonadota bacterium]
MKKLIKPALWLLACASVCGVVFFFFFTLKSAQDLFDGAIPVAGEERFYWLDNRFSIRVAVDQRHIGLFGARADVRIRVADGSEVPLRLRASYGPLFLTGDTSFALATWQVLSREDVVSGGRTGWIDGHIGFGGALSFSSRVIEGRVTLPFGAGRLVLEDARLSLSDFSPDGAFSLSADAVGGRIVMPHHHVRFESLKLVAEAIPVNWEGLGGNREKPQRFARGEFSIDTVSHTARRSAQTLEQLTGEFDAKVFAETLSLEVFGLVGSLPVFSAEETGELEYSFLLSGVDRGRLQQALRRDAELTRTVRLPSVSAVPEPVAGYAGLPPVSLWPKDLEMQQRLLALVRGGVDVYSNIKLTQSDATVQLRFNSEFEHLGEGNSMMGLRNWGELLQRTHADFSFYADKALADWPPVAAWVAEIDRVGLLIEDKFGPSSSVYLRGGDIQVNGDDWSIDAFLHGHVEAPIPAVAALRRARLRAVTNHKIH